MERNLRERRALRPNAAVVADDGSGGKVLALAVDVAHEMVVYVCLPRHFLSSFLSLSLKKTKTVVVVVVAVVVLRLVLVWVWLSLLLDFDLK